MFKTLNCKDGNHNMCPCKAPAVWCECSCHQIPVDTPERPLVSTDSNYPPDLPIGHPDAIPGHLEGLEKLLDEGVAQTQALLASIGEELDGFRIGPKILETLHRARDLVYELNPVPAKTDPEPGSLVGIANRLEQIWLDLKGVER